MHWFEFSFPVHSAFFWMLAAGWVLAWLLAGWMLIRFLLVRTKTPQELLILSERFERTRPTWMTSPALGIVLALGCLVSGMAMAVAAHRWEKNRGASERQQMLAIGIHIPQPIPGKTYTVISKFRVRGRPYVSGPIKIRFAPRQSDYRLVLYYDPKNPAFNAWAELPGRTPWALYRMMEWAMPFFLTAALFLAWLEGDWIRRGVAHASTGSEEPRTLRLSQPQGPLPAAQDDKLFDRQK